MMPRPVGAYDKTSPVTCGELRLAAMDLLARREHSSHELTTKLGRRFRNRDCDPVLIQQVAKQLVDEGLLSNERFAASRVRQLAGRGYGPNRIRNDLRQQRVDGFVSESMEEVFEAPIDWRTEAEAAYRKKYQGRPISGDWDARQRERARRLRFLQYRGFDAATSQALVNADEQDEPTEWE